jgi:ubiquinone/menaquinone biosynthesis C-methylase UbiE
MDNAFQAVASLYDLFLLPLELGSIRKLRQRAFAGLEGRVLELGVGTGINLPLYGSNGRVVGLDTNSTMLKYARRRSSTAEVCLVQADIQQLPFADGSFDTVTGSLIFCSVDDPPLGLEEIRRVMDGEESRLILIEHTRGEGLAGRITDLLTPLWSMLTKSCRLNRETTKTVAKAGFQVEREEVHASGILRIIQGAR